MNERDDMYERDSDEWRDEMRDRHEEANAEAEEMVDSVRRFKARAVAAEARVKELETEGERLWRDYVTLGERHDAIAARARTLKSALRQLIYSFDFRSKHDRDVARNAAWDALNDVPMPPGGVRE
jgi:predicted nuclease with TOPRIM domain